jgi:photosystem II stability/assembly factor-like uncharacterized protein
MTIASAAGSYNLQVPSGGMPCLLQAQSKDDARVVHSLAVQGGVVNMTPLTEMLTARVLMQSPMQAFDGFPRSVPTDRINQATIAVAQQDVRMAIGQRVDLTAIADLISTPFVAASAASQGDAIDRLLDDLPAALNSRNTSVDEVALLLSRGGDAAGLAAQIESSTVRSHQMGSPWRQQLRSAGGLSLGRWGDALVAVGWHGNGQSIISHDLGESWSPVFGPVDSLGRIASFANTVIAFSGFGYSYSDDGGSTWSASMRLPGYPELLYRYVGSVTTMLVDGDRMVAYAGRSYPGIDGAVAWSTSDGKSFAPATESEIAKVESLIGDSRYTAAVRGFIPGLVNLLVGHSVKAITLPAFRGSQTPNPENYWGDNLTEVSEDGVAWLSTNLPRSFSLGFVAEVAPGRFVATGIKYGEGPRSVSGFEHIGVTYLSTDRGRTWRSVGGLDDPRLEFYRAAAAVGDNLVVVGMGGLIKRSTDRGVTWERIGVNVASDLLDVASDGNVIVATGANGLLLRSTDGGQSWSVAELGGGANLAAISWGDGQFVIIASDGKVYTSREGSNWALSPGRIPGVVQLTSQASLAFGGGRFVAAFGRPACVGANCEPGSGGVFFSSNGGQSWSVSFTGGAGTSVTYGAGRFFLVDGNSMRWSRDGGATWMPGAANPPCNWSIAFGDGHLAMPGGTGAHACVSFDGGMTWKTVKISGGIGDRLQFLSGRWVGMGTSLRRVLAVSGG